MNVLIVEAKSEYARQLARLLHKIGCKVKWTDSIEKAANIANIREFDLVFLDSEVDGGDGFALIPELKRAWTETRIIAMTESPDRNTELAARKQGVICYLAKPVSTEKLIAIVEHIQTKIATPAH